MKKKGVLLLIFSLVRPCQTGPHFFDNCTTIIGVPQCHLALVEGNYEFQVRVHSYRHTNRRDWQGRHCELLTTDDCDNIFLFCLQTHGTSQTSSYCRYGSFSTWQRPLTATAATFGDGQDVFAPGVDNPLTYRGMAGSQWIVSCT